MSPLELLLLCLAGMFMGAVNNLAGAAGAVGLLALESAAHLPESTANASLRLAALAVGVGGLLGFHSRGRRVPSAAWLYAALAAPGAIAGALLTLALPMWVYRGALAVVLLIVLCQQLAPRARKAGDAAQRPAWLVRVVLFTLVGLHMGFIQIGVGLLIMAALTSLHSRDLVAVNTAKAAIVIVTAAVSVASLAAARTVAWCPALVLALAAGAGSFWASRWSVARGHGAVRLVVVLITVLVLAQLLWQLASGS